jgi:hypothetical protein
MGQDDCVGVWQIGNVVDGHGDDIMSNCQYASHQEVLDGHVTHAKLGV